MGKVLQYQRRPSGATRLVQSLVWHGHTVVGPAALRVLLLVMRRQDEGWPTTVRDLARATGTRVYAIQGHLTRLREVGLVTWEYDSAATLRATVRLEVCDE